MESITEQLARKCIHFNGIMNDCCKAGVPYSSVRVGKPYQLPCLKQAGECKLAHFRTAEEAEKEVKELMDIGLKSLLVCSLIKKHHEETRENIGQVDCECGGVVNYAIAEINGHIRAKCLNCDLSIIQ